MIASKVGIFSEYLDTGLNSELTEPADPASLASAITQITVDESYRKRLTAGAQDLPDSVPTWDSIAAKTLTLYQKLL